MQARPYSVDPYMVKRLAVPAERSDAFARGESLPFHQTYDNRSITDSRSCSTGSNSLDSTRWNSFASGGCETRVTSLEHADLSNLPNSPRNLSGRQADGTINLESILPHVLSPHVTITTDNENRYNGEKTVWAAVEISGKLSHTYSAEALKGAAHNVNNREDGSEEHQLGMSQGSTEHTLSLMWYGRSVLQARLSPWVDGANLASRRG